MSYGETVEKAYWWTEILDAYCRMLMLARSLGNVHYMSQEETHELLELKQKWGYEDPRNTPEYKNCDVCANDIFRDSWANAGAQQRAFVPPATSTKQSAAPTDPPGAAMPPAADTDQEALIQAITDQVMQRIGAVA